MDERTKRYFEIYELYQNDKIGYKEWTDYCLELLYDIMQENRDVLERLKNC